MNDETPSEDPAPATPGDGLLVDLYLELTSSLNAHEVIEKLLNRSLDALQADRATLSRVLSDHVRIEATQGRSGDINWEGRTYSMDLIKAQPQVYECLTTLRPVYSGHLDVSVAAPEFRTALSQVRQTANIPLVHDGRAVGLLVLSRYEDRPFGIEDAGVVQAISAAAGLALRNAMLYSDLEAARAEAAALAVRLQSAVAAAEEVASETDLSGVLNRLLERSLAATGADDASLCSIDGAHLVVEVSTGIAPPGSRWPIHTLTLQGMQQGRATRLTAAEYAAPAALKPVTAPFAHYLVVPLFVTAEPAGVVSLGRKRDEPFSIDEAASIQQFGTIAALLLRNIRLLESSRLAERSRAEFMNAAVHEMRSPLTVIHGYTDMVINGTFGELSPALDKAMHTIDKKTEELKHGVEELLMLARFEVGSITPATDVLDAVSLAKDAVHRAQPGARLAGGDVTLGALDGSLQLRGDAALIARILDNLLNNSVQYSGEEPMITLSLSAGADQVSIDVRDSGPGVPEDERELIFEKFRRGSNRADAVSGSGLGLYLARGLAEGMGGKLTLHESGAAGSTFRLALPAGN